MDDQKFGAELLLDNMFYTTYYLLGMENCHGKININFYETLDGKSPVKDFIKSLDPKMKAKILRTIDLLETNGTDLRAPYSVYVGDGIFELRVKQGSDISRVFYFFFVGNNAVLTNGFVKKTQKTPLGEISLAKKFKDDYERKKS